MKLPHLGLVNEHHVYWTITHMSLENRVVSVIRRLILHVTHIDSEVGVAGAILKALIFCLSFGRRVQMWHWDRWGDKSKDFILTLKCLPKVTQPTSGSNPSLSEEQGEGVTLIGDSKGGAFVRQTENAHMKSLELHQIGSFTTKISRQHPRMQSCTADANSRDLPNLCQTAEGRREEARERGQEGEMKKHHYLPSRAKSSNGPEAKVAGGIYK